MNQTDYRETQVVINHGAQRLIEEGFAALGFTAFASVTRPDGAIDLKLYDTAADPLSTAVIDVVEESGGTFSTDYRHYQLADFLPEQALHLAGDWWVCASGQESTVPADAQVVVIPMSTAFGDGRHPSTALAADLLLTIDVTDKAVYDLGCGTGVLAAIAARRGARSLFATDIDPASVVTTRAVCEQLSCPSQILESDLLQAVPTDYRCDCIVANIYGDLVPTVVADQRLREICPQGPIVWSGIAHNRLSGVEAACLQNGERITERRRQGWWHAFISMPTLAA